MDDFLKTIGVIFGCIYLIVLFILLVVIFINPEWLIQRYPRDLELEEEEKFLKELEEYTKEKGLD